MARTIGSTGAALSLKGSAVRARRLCLGLTQAGLAEKAECSRGYVSMIEGGGVSLSYQTARGIAEALGVGLAELTAATTAQIPMQMAMATDRLLSSPRVRTLQVVIGAKDRLGLVHDFVDLLSNVGLNIASMWATRTGVHAKIVCVLDDVRVDPWKIREMIDLYAQNEGGESLLFAEGDPATFARFLLAALPNELGAPITTDWALDPEPAERSEDLDRWLRAGQGRMRSAPGAMRRSALLQVVMRDHRGLVRDVTRVLAADGVDISWISCQSNPDNLDFKVRLRTCEVHPDAMRDTIDRLRRIKGDPSVVELAEGVGHAASSRSLV